MIMVSLKISHGVGLSHQTFNFDTTAAGHQPMISSDGDVCLVFNGRFTTIVPCDVV